MIQRGLAAMSLTLETKPPVAPAHFANPPDKLLFGAFGLFYDRHAQPAAWLAFRLTVGGALVIEGWPKFLSPLSHAAFLESLHFSPGWFWSPFLACLQLFGGLAIMAGFLTRPVALANVIMLAVTLVFLHSHPFGRVLLSPEGMAMLKGGGLHYFTPEAFTHLSSDGGQAFLDQVQRRIEALTFLWMMGAALFAAFGGGPLSVDRRLGKEL